MIEEVFDNLVGQFNDPFTFLRELIQNSMDAGSNQVDVYAEYEDDKGRMVVTVADSGEGMDEDLIRNQLTKLFSSTKEDDFTKIGKFGIGFVSVFALQPQLVIVDTGRAGQYWRMAFRGTTDYKLLKLQNPVEGTTIRLFKLLNPIEAPAFIARCRETISYWCKYSETQISFNGEPINENLEVDSCLTAYVEHPGTKLVVGIKPAHQTDFGFYNRGLTLMEGLQDEFAGVNYRLKSHYLEHTLTRDSVIKDENYAKAMQIVLATIKGPLTQKYLEKLRSLAQTYPVGKIELEQLLIESSVFLANSRYAVLKAIWNVPLVPCLHRPPTSLKELKSARFWEGSLYCNAVETRVTQQLNAIGVPVICCGPDDQLRAWVCELLKSEMRCVDEVVAWPELLEKQPQDKAWRGLIERMQSLLALGSLKIRRIKLANFHYPGSCIENLPCLAAVDENEPVRLYNRGFFRSLTQYPRILSLNQKHPLVQKALAKSGTDPELSAFVLAKAALLQDGLPQDLEAKIVSRSWSQL